MTKPTALEILNKSTLDARLSNGEGLFNDCDTDVLREAVFLKREDELVFPIITDTFDLQYWRYVGDDDGKETFEKSFLKDLKANNFYSFANPEEFTEIEQIEGQSYESLRDQFDVLILTDEEADELAKEDVKQSCWAFNAEFIVEHSNLPWEAIEMVRGYQEKCEGANDTILALITDFDEFYDDAISADGRGHFLNRYDGEEEEITLELNTAQDKGSVTFYCYRQ